MEQPPPIEQERLVRAGIIGAGLGFSALSCLVDSGLGWEH